MATEGSTIGCLMDRIGALASRAFQYGVQVEALVRKFAHQRFEPSGFTKNPEIRNAASIIDYVFRWMALQFVRSEEHTSELQSLRHLVCRLLLEKKNKKELASHVDRKMDELNRT